MCMSTCVFCMPCRNTFAFCAFNIFWPMATSVAQARFNDGPGLWGLGPLGCRFLVRSWMGTKLLETVVYQPCFLRDIYIYTCNHIYIYIYCVYIFILKFQFGELVLFVKSFEYGHMFGEIVGKKNVGWLPAMMSTHNIFWMCALLILNLNFEIKHGLRCNRCAWKGVHFCSPNTKSPAIAVGVPLEFQGQPNQCRHIYIAHLSFKVSLQSIQWVVRPNFLGCYFFVSTPPWNLVLFKQNLQFH